MTWPAHLQDVLDELLRHLRMASGSYTGPYTGPHTGPYTGPYLLMGRSGLDGGDESLAGFFGLDPGFSLAHLLLNLPRLTIEA